MAFSQEDRQRIVSVINERVSDWTCRLCKHNEWTLADGLIALVLQAKPGTVMVGGPTLPCFAATCTNCGNTLLLNAMALGLTDMVEKRQEEKEEKEETPEES